MSEAERLLSSLPAIYRTRDSTGHLQRLLGVLEEMLFHNDDPDMPGIEQQIEAIPSLFSPLGIMPGYGIAEQGAAARAPDRFLPWLATWVAFTPHALFSPEQLRIIISGIAPLYSKRGTRDYLEQLLKLCFPEIQTVEIDDNPIPGFIIGQAKVGEDTLFGDERPFWFRVTIDVRRQDTGSDATGHAPEFNRHEFNAHEFNKREFERRVRAIIDFAKPAHTAYELHVYFPVTRTATGYEI